MLPYYSFHHPRDILFKNLFFITFLFLSAVPQYIEAMRVHPMATKRNVAIRDGPKDNSSQMEGNALKKLRKLPHVFGKVLELPLGSDADVEVEEGPEFFRFVAGIQVDGADPGEIRVHAVEIHPGVIKIVVREDEPPHDVAADNVDLSLAKLSVDTWRYRLPSSTRPELATAFLVDEELIVTIPKGGSRRELADGRQVWGVGAQLVLVQ